MHWKSTVNEKEYLCNRIFTHWNFFLFRYENNIYKIEAQIQSKKRIKIKKTISLKLIFFCPYWTYFLINFPMTIQ